MSAEPFGRAGPDESRAARVLACDGCGSPLLQPLRWTRAASVGWEVLLRCPECEAVIPRLLDEESARAYDEEFDRTTSKLADDVLLFARAVFESEIDAFSARLRAGLVIPDDFA